MDALYLQIFVSFVLVLGSVILFARSVGQRDGDHADRLALLPIEEDDPKVPGDRAGAIPAAAPKPPHVVGGKHGHGDSDAR